MLIKLIKKRILWMIPILFTIHMLTFLLFFVVNSPDEIARSHLGNKYVTKAEIEAWKKSFGLEKPMFINDNERGFDKIAQTIFFEQTRQILTGNFGNALNGESINQQIKNRIMPSLAIALPAFILSTIFSTLVAIVLVFFRQTHLNQLGLIITTCLLSVSTLFYIIFAQYVMAFLWKWFPISGYVSGFSAVFFVALPIIVYVISELGGRARWSRMLLMEEIEQAYVTTARANGLREGVIMFYYVLRNALLPLSTAIIVFLPTIFLGSLLFESFFSIPGLGNYLITALNQQDFIIVRAMVLLGSFGYLIGLLLTDIFYVYIDPRVRLS